MWLLDKHVRTCGKCKKQVEMTFLEWLQVSMFGQNLRHKKLDPNTRCHGAFVGAPRINNSRKDSKNRDTNEGRCYGP
jgi:hypothetical protein